MVKVSITLPNNAQITFESEEPGVVEQVITMVLRDLPRDLMGSIHVGNGDPRLPQDWEKSTDVVGASSTGTADAKQSAAPATHDDADGLDSPPAPTPQSPAATEAFSTPPTPPKQPTASPPRRRSQEGASETEDAFIEFCRAASPLGDMRMVVVAAEGARRFLSMEGVDASDLQRLFDLAEWRSPHSFIQTLRNAARSKFRWLERLPGRSGRYTVTDFGRTATLPK